MKKKIVVLGSTGSIGRNALKIISSHSDKLELVGISAGNNYQLLEEQIKEYRPQYAAIFSDKGYQYLKDSPVSLQVKLFSGKEGIKRLSSLEEVDVVLDAIVGIAGLEAVIEAIEAGKDIALANKEALVTGGELVMELVSRKGVKLLPVDSEHSAIFQALQGDDYQKVRRIILTASGGPFRNKSIEELEKVGVKDALKHPNWNMGGKITIDSATLMNKGLEVIEAHWLFNQSYDKINVLIHPQSIVHSLVEFVDYSQIAQLGVPDMRIPIQYALLYPTRETNYFSELELDLAQIGRLEFFEPEWDKFPLLKLAFTCGKKSWHYPVVLNGANEEAVGLFLQKKIGFLDIFRWVERAVSDFIISNFSSQISLKSILEVDQWSRERVLSYVN